MGKVTDVVADITASGYKERPTEVIKSRMNRAAAQLERLENYKMDNTIRGYTNKWIEYNRLVLTWEAILKSITMKKEPKSYEMSWINLQIKF